MKFIFLIITSIFCVVFCVEARKKQMTYTEIANKVMIDFANDVCRSEGLTISSIGGSMPNQNDILSLDLGFNKTGYCDISHARKLIIKISNKFLKRINEDVQIRPYLHNYPFNYENINIDITFADKKSRFISDGFVAHAFLLTPRNLNPKQAKIFYSSYNLQTERLEHMFSETYEEALKANEKE